MNILYVYNFESTECGSIHVESSGTLKSPNYPNAYNADESCSYSITVHNARTAVFLITDFTTEKASDTLHYGVGYSANPSDALGVFDGNLTANGALPSLISVDVRAAPLWFLWTTNGDQNYKGWSLVYDTGMDIVLQHTIKRYFTFTEVVIEKIKCFSIQKVCHFGRTKADSSRYEKKTPFSIMKTE